MSNKVINIGLTDFRKNLDKCTKMVRQGYEFIVFKRSTPIFRVTKPNLNDWKEIMKKRKPPRDDQTYREF